MPAPSPVRNDMQMGCGTTYHPVVVRMEASGAGALFRRLEQRLVELGTDCWDGPSLALVLGMHTVHLAPELATQTFGTIRWTLLLVLEQLVNALVCARGQDMPTHAGSSVVWHGTEELVIHLAVTAGAVADDALADTDRATLDALQNTASLVAAQRIVVTAPPRVAHPLAAVRLFAHLARMQLATLWQRGCPGPSRGDLAWVVNHAAERALGYPHLRVCEPEESFDDPDEWDPTGDTTTQLAAVLRAAVRVKTWAGAQHALHVMDTQLAAVPWGARGLFVVPLSVCMGREPHN